MGDFTGFSFGGYRSSDLGITRVSGGDRYEEEIHPEIKDRTAEVPGVNGEYYFGSNFGPKSIDIEIAFDSLTEDQFKKLRKIFGTRDIKELIFDERPYKKYMAKLESPISLSYICFDEPNYTWEKIPLGIDEITGEMKYVQGVSGDYEHKVYDGTTRRVYKGEGQITFICYFPFARSVYKQLPIVDEDSDWAISSGILKASEREGVDTYTIVNPPEEGQQQEEPVVKGFFLYNCGDLETGFRLYLPAEAIDSDVGISYRYGYPEQISALAIEAITLPREEVGIIIDTNTGLIVGVSEAPNFNPTTGQWTYTTTGNLYNSHVTSGYFFKIQPNESRYERSILQISGGSSEDIKIFYDYLYF